MKVCLNSLPDWRLITFNQNYDVNLPENEFYETLGGLIVYLEKEEIPSKGTLIQIENYEFEIKEVTSTKWKE